MAQEQRGGAGGQQQTRRSITVTFRRTFAGNETYRIDSGGVTQTGWTISTNPSDTTGANPVTFTLTEPVGGATAGTYRLAILSDRGFILTAYIFAWPPVTGTVATATWTNTYFADNKLTSTLTFSHAVTTVATTDFEVRNDANVLQTGWTFDSVTASIAANTGTQIAATAPNNVTADNYYIRLKATSVRGPSATSDNSPAADLDTPNIAVGNTTSSSLTYSTRINFTYPSGIQALHANMAVDNNGFYFAASGKMYAFDWDGTRDSARDVTFAGLSASQTIWGFTKRGSNWVVMTRETGTNTIAMVREYSATGTNLQNFSIADRITTVSGETFRAPKGLITDDSNYYVRVVRSVAGNMRISKYTMSGAATNENIVLAGGPTVLSDLAESDGIMYILQQREFRLYATRLSDTTRAILTGLQTQLESSNNSPWAAAAFNNSVYVAQRYPTSPTEDRTQAYIYQYSGAPEQTVVVLTAAWTNVNVSGGFLRGTITFTGGNVSGIAASDFEVINDDSPTPTVQSWTISTPQATAVSQIISARIPTSSTGVNDMFALRLKATSVRGGTATDDNSPASAVTSSYIAIDTRPVEATASWGTVSFNTTTDKMSSVITFSSAVTGIETTDFQVINASGTAQAWTFDPVTASGTSQTISVTVPTSANGTFRFRLLEDSVRGARAAEDNSPPADVTSTSRRIDNRPAVVATVTWGTISFTGGKLQATITFSSSVTGIATTDFEVINDDSPTPTAQTGWTFDSVTSSGTTQTIAAAPPANVNDRFALRIKKDSVRGARAASDNSPANATASGYQMIDNRGAVVATASFGTATLTSGKLQAVITFNISVTGIETSDFAVQKRGGTAPNYTWTDQSWTFDSVTASGTSQTIAATVPANQEGHFRLRLKATSVRGTRATSNNSPSADVTSNSVAIDNRPALVATASWGTTSFFGGKLQSVLSFNQNVTGIATSDFAVQKRSGTVGNYSWTDQSWTFDAVSASASTVVIRAAAPANQEGTFRLQLKARSVMGIRATVNNSPAADVNSLGVAIDNRPAVVATATFSNQSFTNGKLQATLTFSSAITGLTAADLYVINANGVTQPNWTFDTVSTSGTSQVIRVTPPAGTGPPNNSFSIVLRARSVFGARATNENSPTSIASSQFVTVDNRPIVLTAAWTDEAFVSGRFQATLTFSGGAVRGLEASDLEIINNANEVQGDWTIFSPNATAVSQTILVQPPSDAPVANYNIRLKKDSVFGPRAQNENSPAAALTSKDVLVDVTAVQQTSSGFNFGLIQVIVFNAMARRDLDRENEMR